MILVDTSIWIDHLRASDPELVRLLGTQQVVVHPWVVGEVALGAIAQRQSVVALLNSLPRATVAGAGEVLAFVDGGKLYCRGIGYVDVNLLASVRLMPGTSVWTKDKRLKVVAEEMGIAHEPPLVPPTRPPAD